MCSATPQGTVLNVGYTAQGVVKRAGQHLYQNAGEFLGDASSVEVRGVGMSERESRAIEEDLITQDNPKWNSEPDPSTRKFRQPPSPEDVRAAANASIWLDLDLE